MTQSFADLPAGLFGAKAAMVGEAFKGKGKAATGKGKPGQAVTIYAAVQTNGKGMGVGMGPTNGANGKGMNGKGMNGKGMDGKGMDGKGMAAVNAAAAPAGTLGFQHQPAFWQSLDHNPIVSLSCTGAEVSSKVLSG